MKQIISKETLEKRKNELVPVIFTEIQYSVLKKHLSQKKLTAVEKKYLYSAISKKLKAMSSLFCAGELFVQGEEFMLQPRIKTATKILKKLSRGRKSQKILIGGGFLWKNKYNDVDIFIISRYKKEDCTKNNLHITYLPADAENSLFFASIAQISISNFQIPKRTSFCDEKSLTGLIDLYELLVLLIMQKSGYKQELRNFALDCSYLMNTTVLNSRQLEETASKIENSKNPIKLINHLLIQTLGLHFEHEIIKNSLTKLIKSNNKLIKEHKQAGNLKEYNKAYKEAIEIGA